MNNNDKPLLRLTIETSDPVVLANLLGLLNKQPKKPKDLASRLEEALHRSETFTSLFGVIPNGSELVWHRPREKQTFTCHYIDGEFELPDGRRFASASRAALAASGKTGSNGLSVWCYKGRSLNVWKSHAFAQSRGDS